MSKFRLTDFAKMVNIDAMDSTDLDIPSAAAVDLEQYRVEHRLTYQDIADRLGIGGIGRARRYALGERWPRDPAVLDRIVEMTGGRVTIDAMHRRRREYVEQQHRSGEASVEDGSPGSTPIGPSGDRSAA